MNFRPEGVRNQRLQPRKLKSLDGIMEDENEESGDTGSYEGESQEDDIKSKLRLLNYLVYLFEYAIFIHYRS